MGCDQKYKIEWIEEEEQSIKFEIWNGPEQVRFRPFI